MSSNPRKVDAQEKASEVKRDTPKVAKERKREREDNGTGDLGLPLTSSSDLKVLSEDEPRDMEQSSEVSELSDEDLEIDPEYPIFTDSEDELDDPELEGHRLTKDGDDVAEFDNIRKGRKKVYEKKRANPPEKALNFKSADQIFGEFGERQIAQGVGRKLKALEEVRHNPKAYGVREESKPGMTAKEARSWSRRVRALKIVTEGDHPKLEEVLEDHVMRLRGAYPTMRITAKTGVKGAGDDGREMKKKGRKTIERKRAKKAGSSSGQSSQSNRSQEHSTSNNNNK